MKRQQNGYTAPSVSPTVYFVVETEVREKEAVIQTEHMSRQ